MQQLPRPKRFKRTSTDDLQVHPQKLSFDHFQISKTHVNKFTIRNRSMRRQPLKIISQKNAPFIIKYNDKKQIESNEQVNVTVYFKPTENRFFSQKLDIRLGNSLNKVELTAFSTPIKKRSSKIHNRDRIDFQVQSQKSEDDNSYQQNAESNFQRRCNQLKNYRVDKQINYQKSIGNEQPYDQQKINIQKKRQIEDETKLNQKHKKIQNRFSLQYSKECPVHDRGISQIVKWSQQKNNKNLMLKFSIKKFQLLITKIIKDDRFDKIRKVLTYYMQLELPKPKIFQMMEKQSGYSLKDKYKWKSGEKTSLSEPMQFSKFSLMDKVMSSQYDNLSSIRHYHFDVDPRVSFDDWIPVQQMMENGHQIMEYQYINQPPIIMHQPKIPLSLQNGAHQQYPFIQNKFQFSQYPTYHSQIQIQTSHQFKQNIFYQTPKHNQLQQFSFQNYQQIESDNHFLSFNFFTGLNYQHFHYLKLDVQTKYDVGFYKDIEKYCDNLIGGVQLQDKIAEQKLYTIMNNGRNHKVKDMFKKHRHLDIKKDRVDDYQFINNIQFSMGQLKRQGLAQVTTLKNSCNKLMTNKDNKIVF